MERPADVWLVRFGDNGLDFELVVWVGSDRVDRPGNTTAVYLWAIDDELRAEGIEIPFPQRDLHVRSGAIAVRIEDPSITPAAASRAVNDAVDSSRTRSPRTQVPAPHRDLGGAYSFESSLDGRQSALQAHSIFSFLQIIVCIYVFYLSLIKI